MKKNFFLKKLIYYNIFGFGIVILFLWLNEIIDIPHIFFGAKETPVNITESIFETMLIIIPAIVVNCLIIKLLKKIKYLEGFLRVCSFCRKIHIDGKWIPLEKYIKDNTEVEFTHSLCPECIARHYESELNDEG